MSDKPQIKLAETVVLIDAAFLNFVITDIKGYFEETLHRSLQEIDLSMLTTYITLDAGITEGKNEVQFLFVYDKESSRLQYCQPSGLQEELNGVAFQSPYGEYSFASVPSEGMVSREDLFLDLLSIVSDSADGRLKLGRPWHNNSKTVYINTIMLIPVADEGWTNMGTVPGIFAEYNSRDAQGNVLDLSKRKTEYQYKDRQTGKEVSGTCQATITKEEADKYTYENMIPGNDGWNPRIMMEKLGSPRSLVYQQGTLKWNPVKNAIGYIVYDGEQILGTTTDTSFPVSEVNYALKVSAVNQYGTQGKKGVL